jgi:hypothetical protein
MRNKNKENNKEMKTNANHFIKTKIVIIKK